MIRKKGGQADRRTGGQAFTFFSKDGDIICVVGSKHRFIGGDHTPGFFLIGPPLNLVPCDHGFAPELVGGVGGNAVYLPPRPGYVLNLAGIPVNP